ncbi:hypothetical protein NEDG_00653 [Nematocida displodere]|uniref:SUN domain-containing protein n=1 Tax=Nematocida displodere TaxID=1805483 RepID=A0A177EDP9_9MICR|nr:hypothetical protein NEDG_00653 [Nematocida displodere]
MENRRPIKLHRAEELLKAPNHVEPLHLLEETSDESRALLSENEETLVSPPQASHKKYLFGAVSGLVVLYGVYLQYLYSQCTKEVFRIDEANKALSAGLNEIKTLLHQKSRKTDVADHLEGARIIHELTTPPYLKKGWNGEVVTGSSADLAINTVCTIGHCYSFNGSVGKIAIAFSDQKRISSIAILHPLFGNKKSAIKSFTLDAIFNNQETRVGEFEYELPGDPYQKYTFPPTTCTGLILRVKSNHGHKEYTCIYKIYAFEEW